MSEPKIGTRRKARGGKSEWWDGQKWSRVKPNNKQGVPNEIYSNWVNKAEETYKKQGDIKGAAQHEYNGRTFVLRPRGTRPDGSKRFAATPKKAKKGTQAKRVAQISAQDSEYIKAMVEMGYSEEEAAGKLAQSKVKVEKIRAQVKELNKKFGPGTFSLGHLVAAKEGGGDFGRNVRLERGKGAGANFARAASDEIPQQLRAVLGIPSSGREAAIMDESGMFDLPLTPKDRQDIIRNPEMADDIITKRLKYVETAGNLNFSKGGVTFKKAFKALPVIGTGIAVASAAGQAMAGDLVGAGGTLVDEALSEISMDPSAAMGDMSAPMQAQEAIRRRKEVEQRSEEARQRGGKWKTNIAGMDIAVPELGISEWLGIN